MTTSAADGHDGAGDDNGKDILQQSRIADHEHGRKQTATEPNNDSNERYSTALPQISVINLKTIQTRQHTRSTLHS